MAFNYGLVQVEVVVIILILFLIFNLVNNLLSDYEKIPKNIKSLVLSYLLVLGIIFGIGVFYEVVPFGQLLGILLIVIGASLLFQYSGTEVSDNERKE